MGIDRYYALTNSLDTHRDRSVSEGTTLRRLNPDEPCGVVDRSVAILRVWPFYHELAKFDGSQRGFVLIDSPAESSAYVMVIDLDFGRAICIYPIFCYD